MSEDPRYIAGLHVIQAFVTQDLEIEISDSPTTLRHLILTGPNGSGKSSILRGLFQELRGYPQGPTFTFLLVLERIEALRDQPGRQPDPGEQRQLQATEEKLERLRKHPLVSVLGLDTSYNPAEHVLVFLDAKRNFTPQAVSGPNAQRPKAEPGSNLSKLFLQYLVNKRTEQAYAREDGDEAAADKIAAWFDGVTHSLRELFCDPKLDLDLDRKSFEYRIVLGGERPTSIQHLPDGLHSVLQIWAEIMLHHESLEVELGRAPSGFVLIDELELHLHAELQERLLPFLTKLFPTLQFIVTTHSPAVASSIGDGTVYDLRLREAVPSAVLRGLRYGELFTDWFGIETDFDLDTTAQLERLRTLAATKPARGTPELAELESLARHLADQSHLLALQIWRELEADID